MVIHNTKIDKPQKDGMYVVMYLHDENEPNVTHRFVTVSSTIYDEDGWCGQEPDAWAELPTYDEVKGALYVQNTKG